MRRIGFLLVLALLGVLLAGVAQADTQNVSVDLREDGLAQEQMIITFTADDDYDTFEYVTERTPLAVIYDGTYTVEGQENGTVITFGKQVRPGENTIAFTLIFDDAVLESGDVRTFTLHVEPSSAALDVAVRLPAGFILANTSPAVSPRQDRIASDGRTTTLYWDARHGIDLILLYEAPTTSTWPVFLLVAAVIAGTGAMLLSRRRKVTVVSNKETLLDTLSDDERRVVDLVGKGVVRQKELCRETGFSKSKMSKVIRRLEEKKAVKKEPFFKTNKLELLPGWK